MRTWRFTTRRVLAACAVVGLLLASTSLTSLKAHGGSPSPPPTAQDTAQKILKSPASHYMTAPALAALEMTARGDRGLAPDASHPAVSNVPLAGGGQAPPAPSFSNVRVNDPAEDSHQIDQTTQSETSEAVVGSNVAVGFNDSQQGLLALTAGADLSGYGYSRDGGATFTDGGVLPDPPGFVNLGDPWLTSDRAGNMYYSTLTLGFPNLSFGLEVAVAKSTDGGKTWGTPVIASPPPAPGLFYQADKDAMTAGRDPTVKTRDDLYVAWDDFAIDPNTFNFLNGLPVARSTDGGATWQMQYADRVPLFGPGCSFQQYIGAQPLVDPKSGTLYVAAEKISVNDPNCMGVPVQFSEVIFVSTDGGQTFSPGVKIADVTSATPSGLLQLGPGQYMRTLEFPTLALAGNALYAAWNDGGQLLPASGPSHIRLAKSTDGGQTWSLSWATQGSGDELQPALSGDNAGLHLLFYQRNRDNTLDVMVGNSTNGASFVTQRVTTQSFPGVLTFPQFDPLIGFGYMGDYIANVSDGAHQYFAWGDNRDTVTNFLYPNGRHDPDVFFARQ